MKKLIFNRTFQMVILIIFCVSLFLNIVLTLLAMNDLFLINDLLNLIIELICISTALLLIAFFIYKKSFKMILKLIIFICLSLLLAFALFLYSIFYIFVSHNSAQYSSPDNKNTIVVFENGFVDAYYTAYPTKYGIFYDENNNSSASKVDFKGGAKIEVVWEEDIATVYVIFDETEGRNEKDKMVVPLD